MKKTKLIVFALLLSSIVFGQKKEKGDFSVDSTKVNEFEIDVTNVLKLAVVRSDYGYYETNLGSPYMLSYRRYLKKDFDVHSGIGFMGAKSNTSSNDSILSNSGAFSINYGLGFAHYNSVGKRARFYYGIDAVYGFNKSNSSRDVQNPYNGDSGIYTDETTVHTFGGRPFLGIQFYLSPRISIATQTSFSLLFSKRKQVNEYDDIDNSKDYSYKSITDGFSTNYTIPLNIQLRFRF